MRAAHGAEVCDLCCLGGKRFVVKVAGGLWIEREIDLIFQGNSAPPLSKADQTKSEFSFSDEMIPKLRRRSSKSPANWTTGNLFDWVAGSYESLFPSLPASFLALGLTRLATRS